MKASPPMASGGTSMRPCSRLCAWASKKLSRKSALGKKSQSPAVTIQASRSNETATDSQSQRMRPRNGATLPAGRPTFRDDGRLAGRDGLRAISAHSVPRASPRQGGGLRRTASGAAWRSPATDSETHSVLRHRMEPRALASGHGALHADGGSFKVAAPRAEADALVGADGGSVGPGYVEADGGDAGVPQSQHHGRGYSLRQTFAATVRVGEYVAASGHTLLARDRLHAAHGHQFASAADAPEHAGFELKGGEGDAAAVARTVEPLDFRQVRAAERFGGAGAGNEVIENHAVHLVTLTVLEDAARGVQLV